MKEKLQSYFPNPTQDMRFYLGSMVTFGKLIGLFWKHDSIILTVCRFWMTLRLSITRKSRTAQFCSLHLEATVNITGALLLGIDNPAVWESLEDILKTD